VPNVGAKLPIPDALARSNANDQIQQLFADDLNKDRTPDESAAFAEKLVEQANALGTKPVERYVLLETAIDVAAKGAAVEVAARALKELDRTFAVDLVQLQADAARQVARVAREPWQQTVVVELLESVIDKCLTDERYDLAILLVDAAISAARKARVSSTTMRIAARSRNIRARHVAFQPVRAALQLMADGLDDPSHNETVGTYRCLVKGEWDEGLPFLAKIDESDLRAVAKQDIQLPTELEGQMAVADAWMKLVPDLDRHLRLQALLRAEFWYRQALAQQLGPQVKVIETRISNLGKKIGNIADLPMGAVLVMTFEPKTLQRRGYVLDVSNHGHVGVVSGALRADGKAGKSLAFDGRKSYVEVASTPWLSVPSEFAFVAWVNVAEWINPGKDANYVLCKEDGVEGSKGYILGFSDGGNLDFTFASADSWQRVVSVKQAGLATWHHLAAISDGKVVRLFLDGELTGEGPISEGIRPSGYPFRIGKSKYHESSGIHGRIDEVAVFNRALTPDEVRTIYRIGEAGRPLIE